MSGSDATLDAALEVARQKGCVVRFPEPNQLFIDIDSEEAFQIFTEQWDEFSALVGGVAFVVTPSKSGLPRRHVVATLHEPITDPFARIALQAFFGSDLRHELLSWYAAKAGTTDQPTMFFELQEVTF